MTENQQEDKSQRTEQPTPKKLADARKKGNVPVSREFNSFIVFVAAAILVILIIPSIGVKAIQQLSYFVEQSHQLTSKPNLLIELVKKALTVLFSILAVPLLFFLMAVIIANIMQNGVLFVPEVIKFQLNRISIISGFNKVFSFNSVVELFKGMLKIFIVSIAIYVVLKSDFIQFNTLHTLCINDILRFLNQLLKEMSITVCVIMAFIATFDFMYQRHKYTSNLMMSKEEVKKEHKETEGDPQIKAKLKSIRSKKARERMMASVPKADVVITNPTHYAVALKYLPDKGMSAPVVVAKGIDGIALIIIKIAKENNVAVFEDAPLAQALYKSVDLDQEVPFEHYKSVAKIIAKVMKIKQSSYTKYRK